MEKRREATSVSPGYAPSRVNFFGRRAKASDTTPQTAASDPSAEATSAARVSSGSAGKPYYPSNGHHRHLNFLGRSSLERNDRLLTNR